MQRIFITTVYFRTINISQNSTTLKLFLSLNFFCQGRKKNCQGRKKFQIVKYLGKCFSVLPDIHYLKGHDESSVFQILVRAIQILPY